MWSLHQPSPGPLKTEHSKSGPGPHSSPASAAPEIPEQRTENSSVLRLPHSARAATRGQKRPPAAPSPAKHANKQQQSQETTTGPLEDIILNILPGCNGERRRVFQNISFLRGRKQQDI